MNNFFNFEETEKWGLRKGMVFYFDDWIDGNTIILLETIIEQFLLMTHEEFTKKRSGSDSVNLRNIRGGWRKIFHREFDGKDFTNSQVLVLDSCTPQHLQTIRATIRLSNYRPSSEQNYFIFNQMYFQLPLEIEWAALYQFIESVNRLLNLHYASAGYEMASNILYYPGSAGQSTRALKNLKYVNSEYTEWGAQYDIKAKFGIPCPNFIQVLCPDFHSRIDLKTANGVNKKWEQSRLILDILERTSEHIYEPTFKEIEARYDILYKLLNPIITPYDRPMWIKRDEWDERLRRFEKTLL